MVTQNMYTFRRKNTICECSRSNHMSQTDQRTKISTYVRTYFWVTMGNISSMYTALFSKLFSCKGIGENFGRVGSHLPI